MKCSVKKEKCPYRKKLRKQKQCPDYEWGGFVKCKHELPKCVWCKKEIESEGDLKFYVFSPKELPFPHEFKVALCSACFKKVNER